MSGYDIVFDGFEKLGPGDDCLTTKVFESLEGKNEFKTICDAGCGSGRQTLTVASLLSSLPHAPVVHALDLSTSFLSILNERAKKRGLSEKVQTHEMNMLELSKEFPQIDLLWCESAVYSVGFDVALDCWTPLIRSGGFIVVSDLSWISEEQSENKKEENKKEENKEKKEEEEEEKIEGVPKEIYSWWKKSYPGIRTVQQNIKAIEERPFTLVSTHPMTKEGWMDGFYQDLKPRSLSLLDHQNEKVQRIAKDNLKEIELFEKGGITSFNYVFYVLRKK